MKLYDSGRRILKLPTAYALIERIPEIPLSDALAFMALAALSDDP